MLHIETLEMRTLLDGQSPAQPVGGEFRVNTTTEDDQAFQAASPHGVAMDADGDAVVVWASQNQDGDGWGVFGRRIAPDGTPSGDEFRVNTFVNGDQSNASVAMDLDGDFVVAWNSAGQDGDRSGIFAQRYDARGLPRGGEFRVNQTVVNEQLLPTIAMDAFGNFVIVWRNVVGEDTQARDEIVGRMFDSDGVPLGNEFVISEPTTLDLRQPHVARNAQGEFVVVWEREGTPLPGSSFGQDVYGRTFAADGAPLSGEFRVPEITAGQQIRPTVAMKASGDFIVTWYNQSTQRPDVPVDVFVRQFLRSGEPLGPDGLVNATVSAAEQRFPSIAIDAVGNYTIAWASRNSTNSSYDVFQQAFSAAGEKIGGEAQVNRQTSLDQSLPSIGMSANGDFLIAWTSAGQDGDGNGIYARRYAHGVDIAPPFVTNVYFDGDDHALAEGEIVLQQPSRIVAPFSEAIDVDPGTNARSKWKLYRNGVDVSQQVAVATHVFNGPANRYEAVLDFQTPLSAGEYVLHALPTLRDMQGHALDGDYDGEAGGVFERRFSVTSPEVGDEFRLNQTTQGDQTFVGGPAQTIARNALGNFVAVWRGSTESSAIWMRRINPPGEPATVDERVSDAGVNGDVSQPTVAMAADGRFVVAWLRTWQVSDDEKYYYIEAKRYAADGTQLGSRIDVYEREDVRQERPTIAINELGEFAVVWQGAGQPNGSGYEILMQRFDSDGSLIGARTRVNQSPTGDQTAPSVAMDAHGDLVAVWTDAMPAGLTQRRILARRFSSALDRFNLPLRVSGEDEDLATGDHVNPSVAVDDSGHFIVAWQSNEVSANGDDIYARRFDENDVPLDAFPFRVNANAGGAQQYPAVAIDGDGDFVVAWQSNANAGPTPDDIVYRRFAWNGAAQSEDETIADSGRRNQRVPSLAMSPTGDFVLAWTSIAQDGDMGGLYARRFTSFVNSRPQAVAGGPYALTEGVSLRLDATGSSDTDAGQTATLRYDWDLDNDGAFDDLVGVAAQYDVAWAQLAAAGIRDDGAYPLRLRVTDSLGATSVAEGTLTVRNASPTGLTLLAVAPFDEGSEAVLRGSFTDAGYADTHVIQVEWAPGVVEIFDVTPGKQEFEVNRRYVDDSGAGAFSARVSVTDDDGGTSAEAVAPIVVMNVAPTIDFNDQSAEAIVEGESLTIIGEIHDPGLNDTHTVLVDWGDGTDPGYVPVNPVLRQFVATHLYLDGVSEDPRFAKYRIDIEITDNQIDWTLATTEVEVQNVAPQISDLDLSPNVVGLNETVTLTGRIVDPGALDSQVLRVQWGDASTPRRVDLPAGATSFQLQHTYAALPTQGDSYGITVSVTDKDRGFSSANVTVQVRACSLAGDANDDCTVNLDDLNGVRNHFGDGINGGPRIPGDTYPFDGIVDLDDLNAVRNNFGVSAAPSIHAPPAAVLAASPKRKAIDDARAAEDVVFARWAIEDSWRPWTGVTTSRGSRRKLIP